MTLTADLVTRLLPVLSRSLEPTFNVFDVMHHGLHEKQISNVFRWLLDAQGTHRLGERFVQIFVEEINRQRPIDDQLPVTGYVVMQEVNTAPAGVGMDIADLVLESREAVIVVENYFTSDGHGHSFDGYLRHAVRDGRQGAVILLCGDLQSSLQTQGWEDAPVLTYGRLVSLLHNALDADSRYRQGNREAFLFVQQMHQKFVKGRGPVEDRDVLGFVVEMCQTGEAKRYQIKAQDLAAEQFANDLAEQARERFGEGRELLQRVKGRLKDYAAQALVPQLNETLGEGFVAGASARYVGLYQWTINLDLAGEAAPFDEAKLQIKFGPSAWHANENDSNWTQTVDPGHADYSRLFLTRATRREIRQSEVTLEEVLAGLDPADRRLHDELVLLLDEAPQRSAHDDHGTSSDPSHIVVDDPGNS